MIKKLLFLAFCLILATSGFSQDTLQKSLRNEIGVNASLFVKTFISLGNNNPGILSPYALTYKLINKKAALRIGLGGSYVSIEETDQSIGSTPNGVRTSVSTLDSRIGGELQKKIGKKWLAYFAWDFLYGQEYSKTKTDNVTIESKTNYVGTGPAMGISFYATPRIQLYTEASLYGKNLQQMQTENVNDLPEFNSRLRTITNQIDFSIPVSIFIAFTL